VSGARGALSAALEARLMAERRRVETQAHRLRALSPRLVLERGYCLARGPDGNLLRSPAALAVGDLVALEFARGGADARVERLRPEGE
jgi:exodeoxyribonuclease VII large subunit